MSLSKGEREKRERRDRREKRVSAVRWQQQEEAGGGHPVVVVLCALTLPAPKPGGRLAKLAAG